MNRFLTPGPNARKGGVDRTVVRAPIHAVCTCTSLAGWLAQGSSLRTSHRRPQGASSGKKGELGKSPARASSVCVCPSLSLSLFLSLSASKLASPLTSQPKRDKKWSGSFPEITDVISAWSALLWFCEVHLRIGQRAIVRLCGDLVDIELYVKTDLVYRCWRQTQVGKSMSQMPQGADDRHTSILVTSM